MAFNHYAKLKKICDSNPGFKIIRINKPVKTKRFDGDFNYYDHYYRLLDKDGNQIPYGRFQQLDKLALYLKVPIDELEARIEE